MSISVGMGGTRVKKAVILVVVAMLVLMLSGCTGEDEKATVKISTQEVKQGNLVIGLYADGRVSMASTGVDFQVAGTVSTIQVAVGQKVAAGDVLASLDTKDLTEAITAAQRDLDKAKATYDDSVRSLGYSVASEKIKLDGLYVKLQEPFDDEDLKEAIADAHAKLDEKKANLLSLEEEYALALEQGAEPTELNRLLNAITEAENAVLQGEVALENAQDNLEKGLEKFQSDLRAIRESYDLQKLKYDNLVASNLSVTNAKYNVDTAQVKLNEAKENLAHATLVAPLSGTIAQINGSIGGRVAGTTTASTGGNEPFLVITQDQGIQITANINEGDISGIALGQTVKTNIEALGLIGLAGKVVEVNTVPKIDNSGIVTYSVVTQLDEHHPEILDGMSAFLSYIKREKENVLLLSNKAIFMEDGKQFVWVQKENEDPEKRAVVGGLTNGSQSEIVEGLEAGEVVITSGYEP